MPVIFGPMIEKARNLRQVEDQESTANPETEDRSEKPRVGRIALGVLVAGTLAGVAIYLRRVTKRDGESTDVDAARD